MHRQTEMTGAETQPQSAVYYLEHWLAYLFAVAAICLGVLGLLRGYAIIGGSITNATAGGAGTQGTGFSAVWDGVVWLLPAITAAFLAMALHRNDHHRLRDPSWMDTADEALWKFEHWFAWLVALGTIAMAVIGILVGFGLTGRGDTQPDGLPWLLASIGGAVLTNTLHAVRHHQMAEEDRVVRLVQARVNTVGATPEAGVVREPRPETPS